MIKNILKRTLSVLLALTMVFTTFVIFDPTSLFPQAEASVTRTDRSYEDVFFIVPETIYLAPAYNSYTTSATYSFQWYVNNTLDGTSITKDTGESSSGKIYFSYANTSTVKISLKWQSSIGTDGGSGAVTVGGSSLNSGSGSKSLTLSSNVASTTITAGTSPSLAAATKGTYICWIATYTDSVDSQVKKAYAYTYVYKPYPAPVGTLQRTKNDRGTNSFDQDAKWICGVHGITGTAGDWYPNTGTGGRGFMVFSNSNSGTGKYLGSLYAQFANATVNNGRFGYSASDNGITDWFNQTTGSDQPLPDATFRYYNSNESGYSSGDVAFRNFCYSPTALLTVDTSRYTNLNQIPNLSLGCFVAGNDDASDGAWYVGNFTGTPKTADERGYEKNSPTNCTSAIALWNYYRSNLISSVGNYNSRNSSADDEGVKWNLKWNKTISTSSSTGTYYVGAGHMNQGSSDTCWNVAQLNCKINMIDKGALRNAVMKALKYNATINDTLLKSTTWSDFQAKYRSAYSALVTLTDDQSAVATLASSLSSAVDTLNNATYTAKQFNVLVYEKSSTQFTVVKTDSTDTSDAFKVGAKLDFAPISVTGYDFVGYVAGSSAPTGTITIPSSYDYTAAFSCTGRSDGPSYIAYYKAKTTTVTLNKQSGSGGTSSVTAIYGQNMPTATMPTRTGYTFGGYYTSTGGSGTQYYKANGSSSRTWNITDATKTLYAKWTGISYTVAYNGNGNTGGSTASSTHTYGTAKNLTANGFTRTATVSYSVDGGNAVSASTVSFAFKNWTTKAPVTDSSETTGSYTGGSYTDIKRWTVPYSTGTFESGDKYIIEFDYKTSGTTAPHVFFYGASGYRQVASYTASTSAGYTTSGTSSDGNCTLNITGGSYVHCRIVYTLSSSGGSSVDKYFLLRAYSGTTSASLKNLRITKAEVSSGSSQLYTNSQSVNNLTTTSGDTINMYANWTPGTLSLPTATKTGYSFSGWYYDSGLSKSAGAAGTSITVVGDTTLYAKWAINSYNVTYANGTATGGTLPTAQSGNYNTTVTLGTNNMTKNNTDAATYTTTYEYNGATGGNGTASATNKKQTTYTKNGWTTTSGSTTQNYANGATFTIPASNTTLYPCFTQGTTYTSITLPTPTKTGHTFDGWYKEAELTNSAGGAGASYSPQASGTLYAKWTINKYYVDLNGRLDGNNVGNISGYGTADVYTAGTSRSNDCTDYYQQWNHGTTYEFKDIKASKGHRYVGVYSGSLSGTINAANVSTYLEFATNSYTIAYNGNGSNGGSAPASHTGVYYNDPQSKGFTTSVTTNANSFTKTGYTFSKWNTKADGTGTDITAGSGTVSAKTLVDLCSSDPGNGGTVYLYAKWAINSYNVTYANGTATGGTLPTAQSGNYNTTVT
ncbi:MAG: InlB B-repeat-containing protein, partial [Clostridia bacterium]|nr:InlB B-repeat-containing protein [Clostridia bacterium]